MTDQIIKGTGNSRYLKSNISASATWSDFLAMLRNGTLPIDLNGVNSAGITTAGTPLNKANLLSDSTASALSTWGGSTPDTVNEALGMLAGCAKIQTGSYVGTGTYGASNPCTLTFDFAPLLVFGPGYDNGQRYFGSNAGMPASRFSSFGLVCMPMVTEEYKNEKGFGTMIESQLYAKKSSDGKTLYWYSSTAGSYQANQKDAVYYWCALG